MSCQRRAAAAGIPRTLTFSELRRVTHTGYDERASNARILGVLVARHARSRQLGGDAELALQRLARVVRDVGDDDLSARTVQAAKRGFAETSRAPDDDRGATADLHVISILATRTLSLREYHSQTAPKLETCPLTHYSPVSS